MITIEKSNIIQVYDSNLRRIAFLENAYNIGYEKTKNDLWYANFSMPADDSKNRYCRHFNYIEIYDEDERVELFRIMPTKLTRNTGGDITYRCEHVLATLLDDVMFKYHQVGNIGVYTRQALEYILNFQTIKHWRFGDCDFNRQFEYKWENENLLSSLFSVANPFDEDYIWRFNTTSYPWTLSLKKPSANIKSEVRYEKNMLEIIKESDPTKIVTRLFCLGYGEGDNQLTIESVNNGVPYLLAQDSIPVWGLKSSILVDRRFENPETLKAYGEKLLNELKNPYVSYSAKAIDLYRLDRLKHAKYEVGELVRVIDKQDGIMADLPIVQVSKNDITGSPGDINITIANKSQNISGSISELSDRTRINELYAQGATNQMMFAIPDNAEPDKPAVIKIYIPENMTRVNKCILKYEFEPFRAYSKSVSTEAQNTRSTTEEQQKIQSTSNQATVTTTTSSQATVTPTTSSENINLSSTESGGGNTIVSAGSSWQFRTLSPLISNGGVHNHGIFNGQTIVTKVNFGSQTYETTNFVESGLHTHELYSLHDHVVMLPSHRHDLRVPGHSHQVRIEGHSHTVRIDGHFHTVTIPPHSHTVTIPPHTHQMEFGIFQGTTANGASIRVEGKVVPVTGDEIDLVNYLSVDNSGKIKRNYWHTVEIIPNRLTRIVTYVFLQIFTNSRGGGDY